MRRPVPWLSVLALALAAGAALAGGAITGVVFADANGNGRRDAGEAGLAGVAVSNQLEVVATGADGGYRLAGQGLGVVFVSLPEGWHAGERFWQQPNDGRADFALRSRPTPRTFTFVHASDPHVAPASAARLESLGHWVRAHRPAFVLLSGDLIADALRATEAEARGHYELYQRTVAAFPATPWTVPGNHDLFGIERHASLVSPQHPSYGKGLYREYLGPDYYSFDHGGVHFVALDTVDIADLWYHGHVDAAQLAWLRADLARVPASTPVVTFGHIPFVTTGDSISGYRADGAAPTLLSVDDRVQFRHVASNLDEVRAALAGHRWVLALGGHVHRFEQIRLDAAVGTRFQQAAAIAGPTEGPLPAQSGFTLYHVRDGVIDDGEFVTLP